MRVSTRVLSTLGLAWLLTVLVIATLRAQVGAWIHIDTVATGARAAAVRFATDGSYVATVRFDDGARLLPYPTLGGTWWRAADSLCITNATLAQPACTAVAVSDTALIWGPLAFRPLTVYDVGAWRLDTFDHP